MSLLTVANYLGGIMGGVGTFCTAHRPHKGRQVAIATVFYGISCFWFGALLNFIVCSRTLPVAANSLIRVRQVGRSGCSWGLLRRSCVVPAMPLALLCVPLL